MTIAEVEQLRKGRDALTYLDSRRGRYPVTDVWVNRERTIARVRINSLFGEQWIPLGLGAEDVFGKYHDPKQASHR